MAYNKARAEKAWLKWKAKEEKHLRELGVNEDTIQRLHTYDWEMFKAERNYQQRHIDIGTFPDIASDDSPALPRNAKDFLNNIEDERLYRLLREVDSQTLQTLIVQNSCLKKSVIRYAPVKLYITAPHGKNSLAIILLNQFLI